ncbi:ATP-binding cassette domain-containing protein [Tumebacillus sp. DT12]|uniref:ATP-binding cassette domain-containing protein n=1 Tax=Tumebacillus lacus TaxID=2995335 RepID=A0ABT3X1M9_9BACL|nr:ATP-binding cassette domain-containing protein [Tumebacillus lacus]MCX7569873.1 ATP-binding cassette domain-containing protein [Tumebacillus lacus]
MLQVQEVRKEFKTKTGPVVGVERLTFDVRPGEVFGLLGPNGAGKTTTLRMIATLMKPTSGRVSVGGYDTVSQSHEVRQLIGYLSNETGIYERFTPREQLQFFADVHGVPKATAKRRIDELIERFEMGDFQNRQANGFSTGMKQKVSIARALVHDPSLVIFDEPTAGLDVFAARAVHRSIESLREEGKSVILSTHIMHEVEKLCDRIGVIYKGRLYALGTLEELREQTGLVHMDDIFFKIVGEES